MSGMLIVWPIGFNHRVREMWVVGLFRKKFQPFLLESTNLKFILDTKKKSLLTNKVASDAMFPR